MVLNHSKILVSLPSEIGPIKKNVLQNQSFKPNDSFINLSDLEFNSYPDLPFYKANEDDLGGK